MRFERALHAVMVVLGLLGAEVVLSGPGSSGWTVSLRTCVGVAVALGVRRMLGRRLVGARGLPSLAMCFLAGLPMAASLFAMTTGGEPRPLEMLVIESLRNLALGLLALPGGADADRAAVLVSLVEVSALIVLEADDDGPRLLGVAYAIAGSMWLMLGHWRSLGSLTTVRAGRRPPWAAMACLAALLGCAAAMGASGTRRSPRLLGEWLPASGGSSGGNRHARSGVGQGLDSAGDGERADSSGFDDGETFRESDLPSLYDVMTEVYGTPRPPDQVERAIALLPDRIRFRQGLLKSWNHKAGRRFSLLRETPPESRPSATVEADALLHVKGPTPLHLRTAVFDRFDGVEWYEVPPPTMPGGVDRLGDDRWMGVAGGPDPEIVARTVNHEIRIGLFRSARMPVPLHLERFRVGLVDDPRFFRRGPDGLLCMIRQVPVATVVETCSPVIRPEALGTAGFAYSATPGGESVGPIHVPPEAAELAGAWTAGLPRGWRQIQAVVNGLRGRCTLDPTASTGDATRDPTAAFLCDLRCGPAYHFASATAVMLHALGYRVRLIGGFYAAPDRFDRRSGHTPVQRRDLHFWVEVRMVDGCWLTLDPTPGHHVLIPDVPVPQRALTALGTFCREAVRSPGGLLLVTGTALAGAVLRRRLLDALYTLEWQLASRRTPLLLPLYTLALLDRRCRLAGRPRPRATTPARWYGTLTAPTAADGEAVRRAVEGAARTAFAPPQSLGHLQTDEVLRACRQAVRSLTTGHLRRVFPTRSGCR